MPSITVGKDDPRRSCTGLGLRLVLWLWLWLASQRLVVPVAHWRPWDHLVPRAVVVRGHVPLWLLLL